MRAVQNLSKTAQQEGQRLTLQTQAPLGTLDAGRILAGPLFRGTEAAPQSEMFTKGKADA